MTSHHRNLSPTEMVFAKLSNNVRRLDETSVLSQDMSYMWHGITLGCDFYTFGSCNTCIVCLATCSVLESEMLNRIFCCFFNIQVIPPLIEKKSFDRSC